MTCYNLYAAAVPAINALAVNAPLIGRLFLRANEFIDMTVLLNLSCQF